VLQRYGDVTTQVTTDHPEPPLATGESAKDVYFRNPRDKEKLTLAYLSYHKVSEFAKI
jgi:hypothetical protein